MPRYPKGKIQPDSAVLTLHGKPVTDATVVLLLRASQGMTQKEFAQAVKMHRAQISAYETGKKTPRPATLDRMATALGTTVKAVVEAAESIRRPAANGISPLDSACASVTGERVRKIVEGALLRVALALQPRARSAEEQRADAEELWRQLSDLSRDQRLVLAELSPPFWSPALVERLAEESERVAGSDPDEALALAELGLQVAKRVVGPPARNASARQHAWVRLGKVRQARGETDAAGAAFGEAKRWAASAGGEGAFPFLGARVIDR